ncbi:hypothetical protein [Treponema sp.]|uniref:SecDF P1 head subdomain-containing protein n=1 Tax=Treponema sp. TaxID=166 RepID=UPI0025D5AF26|nr:hypothetical protein [Treponema sp.]MCR5217095.1 hypothetical protein [Treponema sp.]
MTDKRFLLAALALSLALVFTGCKSAGFGGRSSSSFVRISQVTSPFDENIAGRTAYNVDGEEILILNKIDFNDDDFEKVELHESDGDYYLSFTFTEDATLRFARYTEEHIGSRFALLADNKVLVHAVIVDPIPGGELYIPVEKEEGLYISSSFKSRK